MRTGEEANLHRRIDKVNDDLSYVERDCKLGMYQLREELRRTRIEVGIVICVLNMFWIAAFLMQRYAR